MIGQDIHIVPLENINIEDVKSYLLSTDAVGDYAEEILRDIISYNLPLTAYMECRGWSIETYTNDKEYINICDDTRDRQSIVSCKLFLNDGGLITFANHDTMYSPSAGDVMIYPSSYINTYSISDIPEGGLSAVCGYFKYRQTAEG